MSILSRNSYGVNPVDISFFVLSTKYFSNLLWFSISNSFLALTLWLVITTLIKDLLISDFGVWLHYWRGFLKIGFMGLSFERILLILIVLLLSEFAGGLELNWLFHTHTLKDLALGWSKCLTLAWKIAKFFIDFPAIFDVKRVSY